MEIDKRFRNYQRQTARHPPRSRISCHVCQMEVESSWDSYREHFLASHSDLHGDQGDVDEAERVKVARKYHQRTLEKAKPSLQPQPPAPSDRRRNTAASNGQPSSSHRAAGRSTTSRQTTGPDAGPKAGAAAATPTPKPETSLGSGLGSGSARPVEASPVAPEAGPSQPPVSPTQSLKSAPPQQKQDNAQAASSEKQDEDDDFMRQPKTRPISQEQLVAEVKGIYAGLVMVESKCIEVDNSQTTQDGAIDLNDEQWQALIALHRTLLHEHHDFFLASQHPSANRALKDLATRYAMPARMWRHGIHSFLELLRHRLPASLEHMLAFIYLAYSMMALLYETVPKFEDTWIECLGDLGRYRMAIEDDSLADREIWTAVSRHWYSKASDMSPTTGRLYHHLAILSRPNALRQLFYYSKSLCVPKAFTSARESILTLFDPIMSGQPSRIPELDMHFVRVHAILFTGKEQEKFEPALDSFIGGLDIQIARYSRRWLEPGYYIAISNVCALLNYGDTSSPLLRAMKEVMPSDDDYPMDTPDNDDIFGKALELNNRTHRVVWRRFGDPSILAYLHTTLVPIYHLTLSLNLGGRLAASIPWKLLSVQLNTLIAASGNTLRFEDPEFPGPVKGEAPRPLPEDFAMRGMLWADKYLPSKWFSNSKIDDDEKYFEVPSMIEERRIRILWIGCRIAMHEDWLLYDTETHQFSVPAKYDENIEELPVASERNIVAQNEAPAATEAPSEMMDIDEPTVTQQSS
ncbi:hypothetical protein ACHAQH_002452 [Verticillium albo-atrum]